MPKPPARGQLTPKQLELRRTVLGGTDATAIMGVSRYRTAWDVWAEKAGHARAEGEPDEDAIWGLLLEPVILSEYSRRTELEVRKPRGLVRNALRRWQAAHLDGKARDRLVEVKVKAYREGWGEPGSSEVPPEVKMQVMHYLAVTGLPRADIAVLFRGQQFAVYTIWAADNPLADLTAEEEEWWQRHVVQGEQPPFDGNPLTTAVLRQLYPRASRRELVALPHQYGLIEDFRKALNRSAFWQRQAEQLKQTLMAAMEDAEVLLAPGMRITWANRKGATRTDWQTYATELEGMIEHMALGTYPIGMDPLEDKQALKSLHTTQEPGTRVFRVRQDRKELA